MAICASCGLLFPLDIVEKCLGMNELSCNLSRSGGRNDSDSSAAAICSNRSGKSSPLRHCPGKGSLASQRSGGCGVQLQAAAKLQQYEIVVELAPQPPPSEFRFSKNATTSSECGGTVFSGMLFVLSPLTLSVRHASSLKALRRGQSIAKFLNGSHLVPVPDYGQVISKVSYRTRDFW